MGTTSKQVGGGPATLKGGDFVSFLRHGLNTGSFGMGNGPRGAGAASDTMGIAGVLNDLLAGGSGQAGGALTDLIHNTTESNAAGLRARFGAQGGTAFGTGAQFAESQLRAQENPAIINAISQQQMSVLGPLLQSMFGLSQKGIPQAEMVMQPSALSQITQGIGAVAPFIAAPFTAGTSLLPSLAGPAVNNLRQDPLAPTSIPNIGSITIGQNR